MARRLLERVRNRDERRLGEGTAEQLHADRKSAWSKSGRYVHRRKSRLRRQRFVAAELIAADHRRDSFHDRIHEGVEAAGGHHAQDSLLEYLARGDPPLVFLALEIVVRCAVRELEDALKLRGMQSRREQLLH